MNPDHKSLETVFLIAICLLKIILFHTGQTAIENAFNNRRTRIKIARNSVIQISPVANLDMIRGVPKCMQICMCV